MGKRIYITRDEDSYHIELWYQKPVLRDGQYFKNHKLKRSLPSIHEELCVEEFENITGFKLKEGECKAVEIVIKKRK